jgi:L-lactate utilization protein LutC
MGAIEQIVALALQRNARHVVSWASEILPLDLDALRRRGLTVDVVSPMTVRHNGRAPLREVVARAEIGLTGADFALAETGSLVLLSGAGQGRGVSLLPPYHVAVLGKRALVSSLADLGVHLEALHRHPDRFLTGSAVQIVTGPSRTADIEQTLTRGVHGPKEVHVIFIDAL